MSPPDEHHIEKVYDWSDIVLPESQLGQLRELAAQVKRARTVLEAWGFARKLPAAASSNLRKLQALGIVAEVTGRTRGQVFVARGILNFVGRDPAATPPPGPA